MKTMKFKPNELVIKSGKAKMYLTDDEVIIVITNQKRIYINDNEYSDIKEVTYFNRGMLRKDGVHLITKDGTNVKFILKDRKKWENLFSSLY